MFRELREHYRSLAAGEPSVLLPLPIQYADFALWQKRHLEGDYLSKLISYWRETLANLERTEVATDRPRPRLQTYRGARCKTALPDTLVESLRELSRREGVTLFTTMLAGFQILLRHYAGRDDIAVGTPIAERDKRETEDIIGVFINTLVLRTNLSGNPIFRDLLQRTRETVSGALAHYELPFEKLVEVLKPERELGRTPFFQILFEFRNVPRDVIHFSGLEVRTCRFDAGVARFDLSVDIFEEDGVLWSVFDYNTDLFDPGRIRKNGRSTIATCSTMSLPILDTDSRNCDAGRGREVRDSRRLEPIFRSSFDAGSLDSVFEAQAIRAPDAVAAIYGDRKITYGELKRAASRWAACLRSQGVLLISPSAFA